MIVLELWNLNESIYIAAVQDRSLNNIKSLKEQWSEHKTEKDCAFIVVLWGVRCEKDQNSTTAVLNRNIFVIRNPNVYFLGSELATLMPMFLKLCYVFTLWAHTPFFDVHALSSFWYILVIVFIFLVLILLSTLIMFQREEIRKILEWCTN